MTVSICHRRLSRASDRSSGTGRSMLCFTFLQQSGKWRRPEQKVGNSTHICSDIFGCVRITRFSSLFDVSGTEFRAFNVGSFNSAPFRLNLACKKWHINCA